VHPGSAAAGGGSYSKRVCRNRAWFACHLYHRLQLLGASKSEGSAQNEALTAGTLLVPVPAGLARSWVSARGRMHVCWVATRCLSLLLSLKQTTSPCCTYSRLAAALLRRRSCPCHFTRAHTHLGALPAEGGLRCRAGRCACEPAGTAQGSVLGEVEAALTVHLQGLHCRVGKLGRDVVQDAVAVEGELRKQEVRVRARRASKRKQHAGDPGQQERARGPFRGSVHAD
jgi:hypothetical protein